ncbi:MAG: hypothetical protein JWQ05_3, partial [Methylobacterium sp.]|nr:hypothetical protein [Methylobacterium sp.]
RRCLKAIAHIEHMARVLGLGNLLEP